MQRYRPRSISVLALMVAWMAHRLAAINFIGGLGEPGLPESWAVVFYFDLLIGGTAPFLAAMLFRARGLMVWTLGVSWNVFGLATYGAAFILDRVDPWTGAPDWLVYVLYFGAALHLISLFILSSISSRIYFLDKR